MAKTNKKHLAIIIGVAAAWFIGLLVVYLWNNNFQVLNPAGTISRQERNLILLTVGLGMLIVIPVYVMTAVIAWKYREGNKNAKYSPEMSGGALAETLWWGIPAIAILILSIITWNTSHSLDPHKPITGSGEPLKVQVVAMDWKWLFIYPEENVAAVNYVQMPVDRPVTFDITADAPMNSFWIPQLGSQIYAMPGMSTHLNLMADKAGTYRGSSANLSGPGFARMDFTAQAGSERELQIWTQMAKDSGKRLDVNAYNELAKPSQNNPQTLYSSVEPHLYDKVVGKYLAPGGDSAR